MEVDGEGGPEAVEGVGMIFAGEVPRVIDRCHIGDGFEINADSL